MGSVKTTGLSADEQRLCNIVTGRASKLFDELKLHVETCTGPTADGSMDGLDWTRAHFVNRLEAISATTALTPGDSRPDWLLSSQKSEHDAFPPTAVCTRLQPGMKRVLIAGHLDTVHADTSPFNALTVSADGKTATGPGCVDMKGGLVIAINALEALDEAELGASWSFLMNSDEETGSYCSAKALEHAARSHDFGLALEPALPGGTLAIERMGSGQFIIETRGRSAHVGRDFACGVSAVTALAKALVEIDNIANAETGRIVSVGPIEGGTATNAVPDRARAWGNARYATKGIADEIGARLDALATSPDMMPSVLVKRSFVRPPKPLTPATESLALKAREVAEQLGQSLPFTSTGGVCDGNNLQAAGLPTIDTLGVRGGGLHTNEEWIELSSLVERCQLLAVLILRLSHA